LTIYDFKNGKELFEVIIEQTHVPILAHTEPPQKQLLMPYPDTGIIIVSPEQPNYYDEKYEDEEKVHALDLVFQNYWILIIGAVLLLLLVICAIALIYYLQSQNKSVPPVNREPGVYRFNS
jgi:hypothetical protein